MSGYVLKTLENAINSLMTGIISKEVVSSMIVCLFILVLYMIIKRENARSKVYFHGLRKLKRIIPDYQKININKNIYAKFYRGDALSVWENNIEMKPEDYLLIEGFFCNDCNAPIKYFKQLFINISFCECNEKYRYFAPNPQKSIKKIFKNHITSA